MSHDTTESETRTDPFDEAPAHIAVFSRTGAAVTGGFPPEAYHQPDDLSETDGIKCPFAAREEGKNP
jgi:hypothetical protein